MFGELFFRHGEAAAEELALFVDVDDIAGPLIHWHFAGGGDRDFDVEELVTLGDLAREHEEEKKEESHVDHRGDLEPDLVVVNPAHAPACCGHGMLFGGCGRGWVGVDLPG